MDNQKQVTIIIPVKDHKAFLCSLLRSIEKNLAPAMAEIIVVDDGSQEALAPLADEFAIRYHRIPESRGPACARNIGARMATAPILLFLDADLLYPEGLVERILREFEADSELTALSFIDMPYHPADGTVKNFAAVIENYFYQKMVDGKPLARIKGFTTRNGAVRAEAFHTVGGFDERYTTNAFEDYDFGKRLAARYPVAMAQGPLIYHNFPERLLRLLRNYWVRTRLFVPYFLEKRPKMDKAMTSGEESLLRIIGFMGTVLLLGAALLAFAAPDGAVYPGVSGLLLAGAYLMMLGKFIRHAFIHSGSYVFTVACVVIHWTTSITIVIAGIWGLGCYIHDKLVPQGKGDAP